jgi:hypothetical protein
MAGRQQRFGIGFTALGFSALIPWFSSGNGKEAVVAGGKSQALPSISSSLHQSHSTGVVGRPGGIDAEDQCWWGLACHGLPWLSCVKDGQESNLQAAVSFRSLD